MQAAAAVAAGCTEAEAREVGRLGHADLGVGGHHVAFGRGHIRAAFQQLRRQQGRHPWQCRDAVHLGKAELRRGHADQHGDGVLQLCTLVLEVDRLGFGALELGGGLGHVGAGDDAGLVLVLGQLQRPLITGDGRFQQALLGIQHAQLQVVLRQLRLQAEARGGEVGGAGLHVRGVGFQLAAQLAPQVDFPVHAQARVITLGHATAAGAGDRGAIGQAHGAVATALSRAGLAGIGGHRGEERGAGTTGERLGLAVLGDRLGQGLVGLFQAQLQVIEGGVAVQLPPAATLLQVRRARQGPAFGMLELRGHALLRALVVRAYGAAAEQQAGKGQGHGATQGFQGSGSGVHRGVSRAASVRTPRQRLKRWRRRSSWR
ncbi:hypothetical protein D9M71_167580 [compost metagenome]